MLVSSTLQYQHWQRALVVLTGGPARCVTIAALGVRLLAFAMISEQINKIQAELSVLFDQLRVARDPSERKLLLLDCHMLLELIGRLVKEDNLRIRQLLKDSQQSAVHA